MADYYCPLCGRLLDAQFMPSEHPAIPDRTFVHCQNKACDLSCSTDDLPTINALQYAGAVLTAEAFETQTVRA